MGQYCTKNTRRVAPIELEHLIPTTDEESIQLMQIRTMLLTNSIKFQLNEQTKTNMRSCPQKIYDRYGLSTFELRLQFVCDDLMNVDWRKLEIDDVFMHNLIHGTELTQFSCTNISMQSTDDCVLYLNVTCYCDCFLGNLSI